MKNTNYCLGVDLGTTNTVAAVWKKSDPGPEVLLLRQPIDGPDRMGDQPILPSAVAISGNHAIVGRYSKDVQGLGKEFVITSSKRHMGRHKTWEHGGNVWTPEKISGCILKAVRQNVELALGWPPEQSVITIPASFGTEARRATLAAARLAGFDPDHTCLFDEPAAAALHHLQSDNAFAMVKNPQRLLIVDIGGGTLDVSLIEMTTGPKEVFIDIQGRSRRSDLAGDDFDMSIASLLLARYEAENGKLDDSSAPTQQFFWFLLHKAEEGKITLSDWSLGKARHAILGLRYDVVVPATLTPSGQEWKTSLTVSDLAEVLQEFFPKYVEADAALDHLSFFRPLHECIESANRVLDDKDRFSVEDLQHVILAGGSCRLPLVSQAVRQFAQCKPRLVDEPLLAVAKGAAWYSGFLCEYGARQVSIKQRLFDGLYLQTSDGRFEELLPARIAIPTDMLRITDKLTMSAGDFRLEVELFTGQIEPYIDLRPLRRVLQFNHFLPQGEAVIMQVCADINREVHFTFETQGQGKAVTPVTTIALSIGNLDATTNMQFLPDVNPESRP